MPDTNQFQGAIPRVIGLQRTTETGGEDRAAGFLVIGSVAGADAIEVDPVRKVKGARACV